MNYKKTIILILICCFTFSVCLEAVPTEAYHSYVRGLLAIRAGDLRSAIKEYQRVVLLDNSAALAYRELTYLYWQFGMVNESFFAAERLNDLSGEELTTMLFLGSYYLMTGQASLASEYWQKALDKDPGNESAILYLAAYFSGKDPKKAIVFWEKYIEQRPDSSKGYYQLGVVQERLNKLDGAKESFEKAVSIEPEESEAHLSLASLHEKNEDIEAALKEYHLYIDLVPDNMTVLLYLGGLYFRLQMYEDARSVFNDALKLNPDDSNIYFWLGVLSEQDKDWDGAIKWFELMLEQDESAAVLTRLSYYYSAIKDVRRAIKYLKRVSELEPLNPNSYYLLGLAYFDAQKYKPAEENFYRALSLRPDFEDVYFNLGVLYDNWGKFDEAVPNLEKIIELNPSHSAALNYLGYSYADRGVKLKEAEALVKKALELEPENGAYLDSLGWVYYKQGLYMKAEETMTAAAVKIPDYVVFEHLGDVKAKLNKPSEAWDSYHKSLELAPGNKKVIKKVNGMEKLVLPETLQRKVLKRAVGNLLQVRSLKSSMAASGKTKANNFRSAGVFQYKRPAKWRVDILGNLFAPSLVIIQDHDINIYPKALGGISDENLKRLGRIREYFNTSILEEFDTSKTTVQFKGPYYIYKLGDKTLSIDKRNGAVKEYKEGKDVILRFKKQNYFEGLYLPSQIQIVLPADGISMDIELNNHVLNGPMEDTVFVIKEKSKKQ